MSFVDWNQYSLDELCEYLEDKYRFDSSGEALAIHKLILFYKLNKHLVPSKYDKKIKAVNNKTNCSKN